MFLATELDQRGVELSIPISSDAWYPVDGSLEYRIIRSFQETRRSALRSDISNQTVAGSLRCH